MRYKYSRYDPFIKYTGVGKKINWNDGYIVVMQHPVTTEFQHSKKHIKETLKAICNLKVPTFWFWPNVDAGSDGTSGGIRGYRENNDTGNIYFLKNMEPDDFLRLIANCKCLVGNSSVGIRESAFLGVPVVNIGTRQNKRQRGANVVDCDHVNDEIQSAIKFQLESSKYKSEDVYGDGHSGRKVANALANFNPVFHKTISY